MDTTESMATLQGASVKAKDKFCHCQQHFKPGAGKMLEPSSSEEEDEDYLPPNYGQTLEPPGVRQNSFSPIMLKLLHTGILVLGAPEWGASKGSVPWKYVC